MVESEPDEKLLIEIAQRDPRGFAELTEIYQIESDFAAKVESAFNEMIERTVATPAGAGR